MKEYDIIAVAFSKPSLDARLINILRLIGDKKKVCVIGFDEKSFAKIAEELKCDYIPIWVCKGRRMIYRWNYFNKSIKAYRKKIKGKTILAADMYSMPAANGLLSPGSRFLYDSREIYSALGSLHKASIKQLFLNIIEKRYIKKVDEIIVSGEMDAEYLKAYFKHDTPYHLLMNLPKYQETAKSDFLRQEFKIAEDKKIILYQGALINGRGIEKMIDAVALVDNAVLCILGEGPSKEDFEKYISENKLFGKAILCGVYPYQMLHEITSSADIGTAFFEPISLSYKLALPNKLFEYIMAELPVIASDLPAIRKIYEEDNFGILASTKSNSKELAQDIEKLIQNPEQYYAALKIAKEKYHYDTQIKTVQEIFLSE